MPISAPCAIMHRQSISGTRFADTLFATEVQLLWPPVIETNKESKVAVEALYAPSPRYDGTEMSCLSGRRKEFRLLAISAGRVLADRLVKMDTQGSLQQWLTLPPCPDPCTMYILFMDPACPSRRLPSKCIAPLLVLPNKAAQEAQQLFAASVAALLPESPAAPSLYTSDADMLPEHTLDAVNAAVANILSPLSATPLAPMLGGVDDALPDIFNWELDDDDNSCGTVDSPMSPTHTPAVAPRDEFMLAEPAPSFHFSPLPRFPLRSVDETRSVEASPQAESRSARVTMPSPLDTTSAREPMPNAEEARDIIFSSLRSVQVSNPDTNSNQSIDLPDFYHNLARKAWGDHFRLLAMDIGHALNNPADAIQIPLSAVTRAQTAPQLRFAWTSRSNTSPQVPVASPDLHSNTDSNVRTAARAVSSSTGTAGGTKIDVSSFIPMIMDTDVLQQIAIFLSENAAWQLLAVCLSCVQRYRGLTYKWGDAELPIEKIVPFELEMLAVFGIDTGIGTADAATAATAASVATASAAASGTATAAVRAAQSTTIMAMKPAHATAVAPACATAATEPPLTAGTSIVTTAASASTRATARMSSNTESATAATTAPFTCRKVSLCTKLLSAISGTIAGPETAIMLLSTSASGESTSSMISSRNAFDNVTPQGFEENCHHDGLDPKMWLLAGGMMALAVLVMMLMSAIMG